MSEFPFAPSIEAAFDFGPDRVSKYLDVMGWQLESNIDGFQSIFALPDAGARLMLPLDREFDDFRDRMRDALRVISSVHHVSGQALAVEIASASSDILFLRADQYLSDGSIPIREAENLLHGARTMMTAAALAALKPRADFGPARPAVVRDFIDDDVRMGHTMHGSFVITILTNLDEADDDVMSTPIDTDQLAEPELSFNRRVMTTLATGLSATSELIGTDAVDLGEAVDQGVSAQLVSAVEVLTQAQGVRSIDTRFKWSPSHRPPNGEVPGEVRVPRLEATLSKELKTRLKRRPNVEFDQVVGKVVRLERGDEDNNGVAVIDGYVGKQKKRVRLELAPSAYRQATQAHEQRRTVVAEGDITFSRGSFRIANPRSFRQV